MQIRASDWAVMRGRPLLCIDGFGGSEIERELRDDLPSKTEVGTSAETIDSRDGEGIEHVVLIAVDTVSPFAGIKSLKTKS